MVPSFRLLPTPPFLTSFGTEVPAMYLPRKACTVVSKAPNFLVQPSPWAASRIWYSFMDGLKSPSIFFRLHQNAMVLPANSPVTSVQSSFTLPLMSSSPNLTESIHDGGMLGLLSVFLYTLHFCDLSLEVAVTKLCCGAEPLNYDCFASHDLLVLGELV